MNQRSFLTWRGLLSTLMEVFLRTHTEKLEPLMCLAFLFVLCIGIGTLQNGPHINLINLLPFFSFTSMGFNDAWVLKKFRIIRESEFLNCFLFILESKILRISSQVASVFDIFEFRGVKYQARAALYHNFWARNSVIYWNFLQHHETCFPFLADVKIRPNRKQHLFWFLYWIGLKIRTCKKPGKI